MKQLKRRIFVEDARGEMPTISSELHRRKRFQTEEGERVKKNKYSDWEYMELAIESNRKDLSGKEARMLHRELKKYNSGLPMFMRYPNLPLWISIASLLLVAIGSILRGIPQ